MDRPVHPTEYAEIFLDSIRFCQREKGMQLYGSCLMTSHAHLIIGVKDNSFSDLMRDFKRHTSEKLHEAIKKHPRESRREWMLEKMCTAAAESAGVKFRLWQPENHPIELFNGKIAHQKLAYLHNNPVTAGFVSQPRDWKLSSASDYDGRKGLLEVILLDPMIIVI